MIPLVLRPKLLTFKNKARSNYTLRSNLGRDLVVLCFSALILLGVYKGTCEGLERVFQMKSEAQLAPYLPLGLLFFVLFVLLLISNAVAAIGAFYNGRDLDLLLASPLKGFSFFIGKLSEVVLSSSWMVLIFALPAIAAFAQQYNAGLLFYLAAIATLIPYFLSASALSIFAVGALAIIIPAKSTRQIFLGAALCLALALYYSITRFQIDFQSVSGYNEILRVMAVLSFPQKTWLPSYWAAVSLSEILEPTGRSIVPYLTLLYACAFGSMTLCYLLLRFSHNEAYSRARSSSTGLKINSRRAHGILLRLTPFLDPQYRAMFSKESKTFARDIAQTVQLLLLLGLCLIYLYNFRLLHAIQGLPTGTREWWQGFLVFSNIGMGAFVITAVCSRFVFPSVSLEGQSLWILQTGPIEARDVLRAKFWYWLTPVACIASTVFAAGALTIDAAPQIVAVNALTSWIICYGVVGLAIGLGAFYANFDWEHSSQLAASFGSFVFMLASSLLICVSLIPVGILIFLRTLKNFGYNITNLEWYLCVITSAFLLTYINYCTTRWSLKMGEQAILARMK